MLDLLVSDPEVIVIAGGQSLMPVLAFRLAVPSLLVDLRRVSGLGNIPVGPRARPRRCAPEPRRDPTDGLSAHQPLSG